MSHHWPVRASPTRSNKTVPIRPAAMDLCQLIVDVGLFICVFIILVWLSFVGVMFVEVVRILAVAAFVMHWVALVGICSRTAFEF